MTIFDVPLAYAYFYSLLTLPPQLFQVVCYFISFKGQFISPGQQIDILPS